MTPPIETDYSSVQLNRVRAIAAAALQLPRVWVVGVLLAAALSTLTIDISDSGDVSGSFEPKTLTAVLLALVWLPALLRVLALAGGGVKTPAGEATTGGLLEILVGLNAETKRETLPPVLAALNSAEVVADDNRRATSRPIRQELETQLAAVAPEPRGVREILDDYAKEYERLRREVPAGRERTLRMTTITGEARAIARSIPISLVDLRNMLSTGGEGERVVALAIVQDNPDPRLEPLVAEAIEHSRSAFEQYQALGAAFEMLGQLDDAQRRHLADVLKRAAKDADRDISSDSSRARLVDALLSALGHRAPFRFSSTGAASTTAS